MKLLNLIALLFVAFSGCSRSNELPQDGTKTLQQALAYKGEESFTIQLSQHLDGDLEKQYKEQGLPDTDFLDDLAFTYTSVRINGRGPGSQFEPRFTLCARHVNKVTRKFDDVDDGSYTAPTVLVDALPDINELKSFTNLQQYTDLLGPQRGLSDGWSHGWMLFSVSGESEVTVMSIFLNHSIGNSTAPLGLSMETGTFKPR